MNILTFQPSSRIVDTDFSLSIILESDIAVQDDGFIVRIHYPDTISAADSLPIECTRLDGFEDGATCTLNPDEKFLEVKYTKSTGLIILTDAWFHNPLAAMDSGVGDFTITGYGINYNVVW